MARGLQHLRPPQNPALYLAAKPSTSRRELKGRFSPHRPSRLLARAPHSLNSSVPTKMTEAEQVTHEAPPAPPAAPQSTNGAAQEVEPLSETNAAAAAEEQAEAVTGAAGADNPAPEPQAQQPQDVAAASVAATAPPPAAAPAAASKEPVGSGPAAASAGHAEKANESTAQAADVKAQEHVKGEEGEAAPSDEVLVSRLRQLLTEVDLATTTGWCERKQPFFPAAAHCNVHVPRSTHNPQSSIAVTCTVGAPCREAAAAAS